MRKNPTAKTPRNLDKYRVFAFSLFSLIISGYIKDGNATIAGATILVKGSQLGATSNEQGYYELVDVKPGVYTLTVSYLGYLKESKIKNRITCPKSFSPGFPAGELYVGKAGWARCQTITASPAQLLLNQSLYRCWLSIL